MTNVLLNKDGKKIISYDLKRDVFELVAESNNSPDWELFRYAPTTKFISRRQTF